MQQLKLIQLYFYVCQLYEEELKWHGERFTKNRKEPLFTDCELLTTYLFSIAYEQRFQVKQIHCYIHNHWLSWFPNLPSYEKFNYRLNRLASTFPVLVYRLLEHLAAHTDFSPEFTLTDSLPIMTCSNRRRAKVALELCSKGYNAVKKRHFYGIKLHAISRSNPGALPLPEYLLISPANEHDLSAQRTLLEKLRGRVIFGDKAFSDTKLAKVVADNEGELLTPVAYFDTLSKFHRQRNQAADDLYSKAVSSIRQPIESFFNWLIEKTDIQRASKVRSYKGLLVHVFGKIAAALIPLALKTVFSS